MRWNKPLTGWFKLNTDGASFGNPGKVGAGGLIRDLCGNWIKGFSRSIGLTSNIIAKFWALRDGLQLAIQLEIQNIEVELDAKVVVDFMNSTTIANRAYSSPLNDCRSLLRVVHVFREANKCANALAKGGALLLKILLFLMFPPLLKFPLLLTLMLLDCIIVGSQPLH